jgi:hypothetical protein
MTEAIQLRRSPVSPSGSAERYGPAGSSISFIASSVVAAGELPTMHGPVDHETEREQ